MSTRIRLGRPFGIPIGVQPAWLLIVALIAWSLGTDYYPERVSGISAPAAYALGPASALLLFAGVLLHELGALELGERPQPGHRDRADDEDAPDRQTAGLLLKPGTRKAHR